MDAILETDEDESLGGEPLEGINEGEENQENVENVEENVEENVLRPKVPVREMCQLFIQAKDKDDWKMCDDVYVEVPFDSTLSDLLEQIHRDRPHIPVHSNITAYI